MIPSLQPKRILPWVVLLLVLVSPQHYRIPGHTANESTRIYTAQALAFHDTVRMDPVFDIYYPGWRSRSTPPNFDVSRCGESYCLDKAPGISLLSVPVLAAYRLGGGTVDVSSYPSVAWWLMLLFAAIPTIFFCAFFGRWLQREPDLPEKIRWWLPLGLALCTPWLAYGGLLFGHALAAACIGVGSLLALGSLQNKPGLFRRRHGLLAGFLFGVAVLTEYPTAILVLLVCTAVLADSERRQRLPFIIAGGIGPAFLLLVWNWLVFGHPLELSYAHKVSTEHQEILSHGFFGFGLPSVDRLSELLFGSKRGLFFVAPWLVLAPWATFVTTRSENLAKAWKVVLVGGTFGAPVLLSGFVDWDGGEAMGPRHLVAALPFFGVGVALWLRHYQERYRGGRGRHVLLVLLFSSFLFCLLAAHVFPYFPQDIENPIFELSLPVLLDGNAGPSIWDPILPSGFAVFSLPLVAGLILLGWALRGTLRAAPGDTPRSRPSLAFWFAGGALLFHLLMGIAPITPGRLARGRVAMAQAQIHERLGQEKLATSRYSESCQRAWWPACIERCKTNSVVGCSNACRLEERQHCETNCPWDLFKGCIAACRLGDPQSCATVRTRGDEKARAKLPPGPPTHRQ
ncbi:MAG: hypothetical protein CMH54_03790 [Myxococcales bacterium]|nr:hypothetical protein [Myxococcales bacterium]